MKTELIVFGISILMIYLVFIWDTDCKEGIEIVPNYINPTEFEVGEMKTGEYKSANLCNDKVLYPINSIDVNYNDNTTAKAASGNHGKSCGCQEFIQSP
jgi:hypothetical protein